MADRYRTGNHNPQCIYRVGPQDDRKRDRLVATAMTEEMGPLIVAALNAYTLAAGTQDTGDTE